MKYPGSYPAPHPRTVGEGQALIITGRDEMHRYVRSLWRTDLFRQSHDNGGLAHQIVDKLATWPRYFFERTDDRRETALFTAWWGGIQLRPHDYDNDYIHDLYLLHEMCHAGTMPCRPGLLYDSFMQKSLDNEAGASVISEIAAYFAIPGLREKAFGFEIYADRFLSNPVYQTLWGNNRAEFIEGMIIQRRDVMHPDYKPADLPEKWIHLFAEQNRQACAVWKDCYDRIEQAMWKLRVECTDSKTGRAQAMKNFMAWLTSPAISRDGVPFYAEAGAFADIYWRNKTEYKKEVERDNSSPAAAPPPVPAVPRPA
jgi:hypothetical protein